jgi:hypothetical protein
MPEDRLLRKVAGLCREALMKHLMPRAEVTAMPAPGANSSELPGKTEEVNAGEIAAAGPRPTQTSSEERTEMDVS